MDTPTATWRKAAAVYVRGSKIERISEDQTLCGSEFELNLEGLFLIPGLIDPHVHISENPSRKAVMFSERSIDASVQLVVENGTTALDFGITTVRDMGSHLGNLSNILNDERLISYDLPEIIHCGQILTYDEGHMSSCGAAIEGIYDGRRVIADNRRSGASFTKVTSDPEDTEAQGREPNPAFSKETLSGIADVSESVGLPVACHTFPSVDGVSRALEAGVFTIEHAVPLNDPQMTRAKANGSIFVPTLVAAFDDFPPNFLETRYGIARDTLEFWDRAAGDQTRQELDCDPPESIVTWVDRVLPRLGKALAATEILVLPGSDAGCPGTSFGSLLREMFILSMFGQRPIDVVCAATFGASRAVKRADLGRIAVGAKADFVVLSDNLQDGLEGLTIPRFVIKDGKVVRSTPSR